MEITKEQFCDHIKRMLMVSSDETVKNIAKQIFTGVHINIVGKETFEVTKRREPFAISTSDGHNEDWTYYKDERDARKAFVAMQTDESDIHLYKLTDENEYEVIDSFWDGD